MNRAFGQSRSPLAFLAVGIALCAGPSRTAAQVDNPNAKACALLPKADLQAVLGEKPDTAPWRAQDSEYGSLCSLRFVAKGGKLTLELYSPKSLEFDAGRALVIKAAAKRSS